MDMSQLPGLYDEIMNHPHASDDLRRSTESKLLRYKQQLLHALPNTTEFVAQKRQITSELHDLISGMVLLQISDELAWLIFIEGKDAPTIRSSIYSVNQREDSLNIFQRSTISTSSASTSACSRRPQ